MIMAMIIFMVIISLLLQLVEACWRHSGLSGSSPSPSPPKRSHVYSTQWWSPWLWWSSSSPLIRGLLTSSWPLWAPQASTSTVVPGLSASSPSTSNSSSSLLSSASETLCFIGEKKENIWKLCWWTTLLDYRLPPNFSITLLLIFKSNNLLFFHSCLWEYALK